MDSLSTFKPIVNMSERQLMRYQTIAHYALMGIHEQIMDASDEDKVDLFIARNKWRVILESIKNLLSQP